jgi:uncharacterized membrane protein HdeD (DUF308 family)
MTAVATPAAGATDRFSNHWWVVLLQGIALVIIGILLITDTDQTLFTLILFLGFWWFIGGIFDLISIMMDHRHWGWKLVTGILGIIAGVAVIRHPMWAALLVPATIGWMLGVFGVVIGVLGVIRAFQGAGLGVGIVGVVSAILGVLLLGADIGVTAATIIVAGAVWAIIGGIVSIIYAFRLRPAVA